MNKQILLPVLLAELGIVRAVPAPAPDIELFTHHALDGYPVLRTYAAFCKEAGLSLYGGGTREKQGNVPGRITSGYRDEIIGHNRYSAHRYGLAIDVYVHGAAEQLRVGKIAIEHYCRIGFYPNNNFLHLDLMSPEWAVKWGKVMFWVKGHRQYLHKGNDADAVLTFMEKMVKGQTDGQT